MKRVILLLFFGAKLFTVFILSFIFIKLIIHYAPSLGLIDIPNHRSHHKKITPRGAGIGIVFAVICSDLIFLNTAHLSHPWILIGIFIIFAVGILDDHRNTSPNAKFLVIFIAVVFFYVDGTYIKHLGHVFGYSIPLGWFAFPFTLIAIAGFTNALNLSDGLDGLAASLSIIILSALCFIGYVHNDSFMVSLSLSFISALVAFLWFNWNPAKIFMGDSGSLTLGVIISIVSIRALDYVEPITILFIAALPIIDTLIVMIRRKRNGRSMFSPDKTHLHHLVLQFFKGNVRKTVILLTLGQLFYSFIGLTFIENSIKQRYILLLFILLLVISYILLNGMLERQTKPFTYHRKKRNKKRSIPSQK